MQASKVFKRTVNEPKTSQPPGNSQSSFRKLFDKLESLQLTGGVLWDDLHGSNYEDIISMLDSVLISCRRLVAQSNPSFLEKTQELLGTLSNQVLSFVHSFPNSEAKAGLQQQCQALAGPLKQKTEPTTEVGRSDYITLNLQARMAGSNAQVEKRKIESLLAHTKGPADESWQHHPVGANSSTVVALRQANHIAFSGAQWAGRLTIVDQGLQNVNPVNANFDRFGYWLGEYKSAILSLVFAKPELIVFKNWIQSLDPAAAQFNITAVKLGGSQEVSRGYMGGTDRVGRGALIVKNSLLVPIKAPYRSTDFSSIEVLRVFALQQLLDGCEGATFDASSLARVFLAKDLGLSGVEGFTILPQQRSGQTSSSGIDESTALLYSADKIRLVQCFENGQIQLEGTVTDVAAKMGAFKISCIESFDDFLVIAYRGASSTNHTEAKTTRLGLARRRAGAFVFEKAQDIGQESHIHQMVLLHIKGTRMVVTLTANARIHGWFVNPFDELSTFVPAFRRTSFTCGGPGTLLAHPFKPRGTLANGRTRTLDLLYASNEPTRISLTFG